MPQLISIEDAQTRLDALIKPLSATEQMHIADAVGRTLAQDIFAPLDLPPFNSSAMDGYALCLPVVADRRDFKVIGESRAGHPYVGHVQPGECTRIFTGAVIPTGANTVVLQEDVKREANQVEVKPSDPLRPNMNIRGQGSDVRKNQLLLSAGTRFNEFHIGWLAACGIETVMVRKQLTIALFSTGDELQDPGVALLPGQIYDSNRVSLTQLLRNQAVNIVDLGRLPDDETITREQIQKAAASVDILLTTGGVSVGDSDFVRPAIEALGELAFWNIALKPGKPLAVGTIGNCLFFGLPGNPVSAVITYLLFVNRAIEQLSGAELTTPLRLHAKLLNNIHHTAGRREYQRGAVKYQDGCLAVSSLNDQSSNRLTSFVGTNCLIEVSEEAGDLPAGSTVAIYMLNQKAAHLATL